MYKNIYTTELFIPQRNYHGVQQASFSFLRAKKFALNVGQILGQKTTNFKNLKLEDGFSVHFYLDLKRSFVPKKTVAQEVIC